MRTVVGETVVGETVVGETVVGETVVGETVDWVEVGINLVKVFCVVVETRSLSWVEDEIGSVLVSGFTLNPPFKKILD